MREVPTNSVAYEADDIVSLASCVGQFVCPDARGDKASLSCVTFRVGCRLHQEVLGAARTEAPSLCRIWAQAVAWREVFSKNDGAASRCLAAL